MQQADDNAGVTVHGSFHRFLLPVCLKWEALCGMGHTSSWQGGHRNSATLMDRVSPIRFHSLSLFPFSPLSSPPPHLPPCFLQSQFGERNLMQLKTKVNRKELHDYQLVTKLLKIPLGQWEEGAWKRRPKVGFPYQRAGLWLWMVIEVPWFHLHGQVVKGEKLETRIFCSLQTTERRAVN